MVNLVDYPTKIIVVPDDDDNINVMGEDSDESNQEQEMPRPSTSGENRVNAGTQTNIPSPSESSDDEDVVFVGQHNEPMEDFDFLDLPSTPVKEEPKCSVCKTEGNLAQSNPASTSQTTTERAQSVQIFDEPMPESNRYNVYCYTSRNGSLFDPTTGNVTLCRNPSTNSTLQGYLVSATAESAIYIVCDSASLPTHLRSTFCFICSRVHPQHMQCASMPLFTNMHVAYTRNNDRIVLPYSIEVVEMEGNQGVYHPSIDAQDLITIGSSTTGPPINLLQQHLPTMSSPYQYSRMQSDPINLSFRQDIEENVRSFGQFGLRNRRITLPEDLPSSSNMGPPMFQYNPSTMNNIPDSFPMRNRPTSNTQNRLNPFRLNRRAMQQPQNRFQDPPFHVYGGLLGKRFYN